MLFFFSIESINSTWWLKYAVSPPSSSTSFETVYGLVQTSSLYRCVELVKTKNNKVASFDPVVSTRQYEAFERINTAWTENFVFHQIFRKRVLLNTV